jgi:hypothetical protein
MKKPREDFIAGQPIDRVWEFLCSRAERTNPEEHEDDRFERFAIESMLSRDRTDEMVQELLARGWIESANNNYGPTKIDKWFRLTEAGRLLAAQSAHLFKWPAAQSTIRPAPTYGDWFDCLIHLRTELARLGKSDPDKALRPYQRETLRAALMRRLWPQCTTFGTTT